MSSCTHAIKPSRKVVSLTVLIRDSIQLLVSAVGCRCYSYSVLDTPPQYCTRPEDGRMSQNRGHEASCDTPSKTTPRTFRFQHTRIYMRAWYIVMLHRCFSPTRLVPDHFAQESHDAIPSYPEVQSHIIALLGNQAYPHALYVWHVPIHVSCSIHSYTQSYVYTHHGCERDRIDSGRSSRCAE